MQPRFDIFDNLTHILGAFLLVGVLVLASVPALYAVIANIIFWYVREALQRSPHYSTRLRWVFLHWGANKNAEWITPGISGFLTALGIITAFPVLNRVWL